MSNKVKMWLFGIEFQFSSTILHRATYAQFRMRRWMMQSICLMSNHDCNKNIKRTPDFEFWQICLVWHVESNRECNLLDQHSITLEPLWSTCCVSIYHTKICILCKYGSCFVPTIICVPKHQSYLTSCDCSKLHTQMAQVESRISAFKTMQLN